MRHPDSFTMLYKKMDQAGTGLEPREVLEVLEVVEQGKWKVGCLLSNGNTKVLARRESPGNLAWIRY